MNISKNPKIFDLPIAENKNGGAIPPHVPPGWWSPEQRLSMDAMESQLARDSVVLFDQIKNVRCVVLKRVGDPPYIIRELRVSDENRAERTSECEVPVEYFRNQANVCVIPHVFVESADQLLLGAKVATIQIHRGLKSWRCSNHFDPPCF